MEDGKNCKGNYAFLSPMKFQLGIDVFKDWLLQLMEGPKRYALCCQIIHLYKHTCDTYIQTHDTIHIHTYIHTYILLSTYIESRRYNTVIEFHHYSGSTCYQSIK